MYITECCIQTIKWHYRIREEKYVHYFITLSDLFSSVERERSDTLLCSYVV